MAYVALQGIVVLTTLLAAATGWDSLEASQAEIYATCAVFVLQSIWALWSWRAMTGRGLDTYILFLLALLLFSGGELILVALQDVEVIDILNGQFASGTVFRSALLVNAAIAAFHFGALASAWRGRADDERAIARHASGVDPSMMRLVGVAFLLISVGPAVTAAIDGIALVAREGYFGLYQQSAPTGMSNWRSVVSLLFLPGVMIVLASSPKSKAVVIGCWVLALASTSSALFMGARAAAVISLMPVMMLHHLSVKQIRPTVVAGLAVVAIVLIPWIGEIRTRNLQERSGLETQVGLLGNPLAAGIREMGGTLRTVAHTIEAIPERQEFEWGEGYVRALLTVVPNLFWDIHPALAAGTYSSRLIWDVDPGIAQLGGGIGFSMLAEAYANFSWWGTPLVFALAGWALATFVVWVRAKGDGPHAVLEALVLSAIIVLPRGESAIVTRGLIWTTAVPYLAIRLLGRPQRGRGPGNKSVQLQQRSHGM